MNGIDLNTITNPATSAPDNGKHLKLKKAAQDFEGMLLGTMWKSVGEEMKQSMEGDSASGSFVDMGVQAVSNAMAKSGGVGVARMLLKKLETADSKPIQDMGQSNVLESSSK